MVKQSCSLPEGLAGKETLATRPSVCSLTVPSSQPTSCLPSPMQGGTWSVEKVIQVPSKKVKGWLLPEMPGEFWERVRVSRWGPGLGRGTP